jgi:PilZ domain
MQDRSVQLVDARREPRLAVHWRARLLLPDGRGIDVRIKDISDSGMGLTARDAVPAGTTLSITVQVPDPGGTARATEVAGQVKVAYAVLRGYEFGVGTIWVEREPQARALMSRWIAKLLRNAE